jgi:hypothetical protein
MRSLLYRSTALSSESIMMPLGDKAANLLSVACVIMLVGLIVGIFFSITLHNALGRISPKNRRLPPSLVWLLLVPCFNVVWQFVIVVLVPASLRNEFRDRGQDDGTDYGKSIGLAQAAMWILATIIRGAITQPMPPETAWFANAISLFMDVIGIVLFVLFWVRVASYSRKLASYGTRRQEWLRRFDKDEFDRGEHDGREPPSRQPPPSSENIEERDQGRYQ